MNQSNKALGFNKNSVLFIQSTHIKHWALKFPISHSELFLFVNKLFEKFFTMFFNFAETVTKVNEVQNDEVNIFNQVWHRKDDGVQ